MKRCVPHRTDALLGLYLFEPTCLFVETLPRLFILPVFPFFLKNNKNSPNTAYHFIFVRLFCKLSSSGSYDPYHIEGTRSVLSWETIVHYPRYKLRGQIRLKDTTLSLGSDLLFNHCLYYRFVSFKYFMFLILNEHGNYNLKTNFLCRLCSYSKNYSFVRIRILNERLCLSILLQLFVSARINFALTNATLLFRFCSY